MITKKSLPAFVLALLTIIATSCTRGTGTPGTPTLSTDVLVQTAVAATAAAEAAFNQGVEQAAQATITALPPTPTPGPTVDYYTLSEEELATLIDDAVTEAIAASEEAATSTSQATEDGAMTSDEVYDTITYVYTAEAAIEYADELIAAYYDLYGAYAEEALGSMEEIENDLSVIADSLESTASLLEQGAETAATAIDELNATAEEITTRVDDAQEKAQGWKGSVQASLQEREQRLASLSPTEIASDRTGTISQVYDYLDAVKSALADHHITPEELNSIGQLSANAQASLRAHTDAQLQSLPNAIDALTRQLARGEWPQAQRGLGSFETSLPSRPSRPSRP